MAENSNIEWTTHTFNPWRVCLNPGGERLKMIGGESYVMVPVGKNAAGRMLDGRVWDEFPEVAHAHC